LDGLLPSSSHELLEPRYQLLLLSIQWTGSRDVDTDDPYYYYYYLYFSWWFWYRGARECTLRRSLDELQNQSRLSAFFNASNTVLS
jgi:hypothetical protein